MHRFYFRAYISLAEFPFSAYIIKVFTYIHSPLLIQLNQLIKLSVSVVLRDSTDLRGL